MNDLPTRLRNRFQRSARELEVDEELHLHLELLQREYMRQGMSLADARAAALKRFGNLQRIKHECVTIRTRNRPLQRALKMGAILVALTGISLRIVSSDFHITHAGDVLIAIAVLSRLLLYVRSLTPSRFLPAKKHQLPKSLNASH